MTFCAEPAMYEPCIVYESSSFLVLYKPPFMHTVPLRTGEKTLLDWCVKRYPEMDRVRGKTAGDKGILHRLDRETRGLVLAALNQEAFENLKRQQEEDRIVKSYGALLAPPALSPPGFPPLPPKLVKAFPPESGATLYIESAFRAYGPGRKAVRPVTGLSGAARSAAGKNRLYRTALLAAKDEPPRLDGNAENKFFYAEL
ncbi:MAG: hypothetical protein LBH73_02730, partial [Spirochaetaceae bacterium]|nr:hypothetical protein [Spirochaetaceae bacterium]